MDDVTSDKTMLQRPKLAHCYRRMPVVGSFFWAAVTKALLLPNYSGTKCLPAPKSTVVLTTIPKYQVYRIILDDSISHRISTN